MGVGILTFDGVGEKKYETGIDHCVLYPLNPSTGLYDDGFAWNGITAVNEKPTGGTPNPTYADNIKYSNLLSLEIFEGTLQAYTYPNEFAACDGSGQPVPGLQINLQGRQTFGLSYRTKVGDDANPDRGFKYHLAYGLLASPSEKDFTTINDSPAEVEFSWDFTSTPVPYTAGKPTSLLTFDSTLLDATALGDLLDLLYGTVGTAPSLPLPDVVTALFTGSITAITLSPATFDGAHTITIPTQTGVKYYLDGVEHAAGTVDLTTGQSKVVSARAQPGYVFNKPVVTSWLFTFVS